MRSVMTAWSSHIAENATAIARHAIRRRTRLPREPPGPLRRRARAAAPSSAERHERRGERERPGAEERLLRQPLAPEQDDVVLPEHGEGHERQQRAWLATTIARIARGRSRSAAAALQQDGARRAARRRAARARSARA